MLTRPTTMTSNALRLAAAAADLPPASPPSLGTARDSAALAAARSTKQASTAARDHRLVALMPGQPVMGDEPRAMTKAFDVWIEQLATSWEKTEEAGRQEEPEPGCGGGGNSGVVEWSQSG
nr:unnamed protein product [Digitaria exilis]